MGYEYVCYDDCAGGKVNSIKASIRILTFFSKFLLTNIRKTFAPPLTATPRVCYDTPTRDTSTRTKK